ncbi:tetraspanin-36-like [Anneissia japonica]|uniref:tetraspanin-36-like n=1 Tax=Anneissia japonica TaxID=1529436 RepID=UPI0014256B3E|nr:tetraspanin-36-like [Anneissia japonica]
MDFNMATVKLFMGILGICFTVIAGCLMYAGVIVFKDFQEYDKIIDQYYILLPGAIMIAASVVMFVLGIIACYAARREKKCLLTFFFVFLLVLVVSELVGGSVAVVYKEKVNDRIVSDMRRFLSYYHPENATVQYTIDIIQENFQCCGVNSSADWKITPWGKAHQGHVPNSCCKKNENDCSGLPIDIKLKKTNAEGCYSKAVNTLKEKLNVIIGASSGTLITQIFGLISSKVYRNRLLMLSSSG